MRPIDHDMSFKMPRAGLHKPFTAPKAVLPVCLVILLGLAICASNAKVGSADNEWQNRVQVSVLDNGVQVVLAPAVGSGLSTVNVWIKAGTAQDPPDRQGLAHYLEHMVLKGPEQSPNQARNWVESRGGYINAYTYSDYTEYHVVIPSEHTHLAIDLMADLVTSRNFSHPDMETERSVVLRERDRREDDPSTNLWDNSGLLLFGSNSSGFPIVGTVESIQSITRTDLAQWAERFYVPGNMTVVVVGDGDRASLLEQVKSSFGAIEPGPLPTVAIPAMATSGDYRQHTLEHAGELERLVLAWAVPALQDLEDLATKEVLAYLLSWELDHEHGTTNVDYNLTLSPGLLMLEFEFPNYIDSGAVRDDVLTDLAYVLSGHVYREHMALAKKWLIDDLVSRRKTSVDFADQLGRFAITTGDPLDALAYIDLIQRVGKRQLLAMARELVPVESRLELRLVDKDDEAGEFVAADLHSGPWEETWALSFHRMLDDMRFVVSNVGSQLSVRTMKLVAWIRSMQWNMFLAKGNLLEEEDVLILDNGMRILLLPDSATNFVEVHVLVGTGIGMETADEAGISRFTNDFLLYWLDDDHFRRLDASSTTEAGFDSTSLTLLATETSWPAALPPFLKYILEPEWIGWQMEGHRSDVVQKIRARDEIPFEAARLQLRTALFGEGGYANPRTGTIETVSSFSIKDMIRFHGKFFVPENMVVVAAGNFEPKLMAATLAHTLSKLNPAVGLSGHELVAAESKAGNLPDPFRVPAGSELAEASPQAVARTTTDWEGIQLAWILMGFPGPGIADDDFATFLVLNSVLGRGSSSRLFAHFREQDGYAYDLGSFVTWLKHGSFMTLYAQVLPGDIDQFVNTAVAEVHAIVTEGIPPEELEAAIAREVGAHLRYREWIGDRAFHRGLDVLYGIDFDVDGDFLTKLENVSMDGIRDMAQRLLVEYYVSEIVPAVSP
ncbi:MAG: insulinase family protein [Caldilineaceae bacterium SB0664_bin_22]|nr:insulinase family protein [Caldilineaceae bacterium SB0664_bin_22]